MKNRAIRALSAFLCIALLVAAVPVFSVSAASNVLYSGNFADGNWSSDKNTTNASGSVTLGIDPSNGRFITKSTNAGATATLGKTFDTGSQFFFKFGYSITNNYNCTASNYSAVTVGKLQLRISDIQNPDAPADNYYVTKKYAYATKFRLFWDGAEITPDYTCTCTYSGACINYAVYYDNGNIYVTRQSTGENRVVLRVSAETFNATVKNPTFSNSTVKIYLGEQWKTTYFSDFSLSKGTANFSFIDYHRTNERNTRIGDIDGNDRIDANDLLIEKQFAVGLREDFATYDNRMLFVDGDEVTDADKTTVSSVDALMLHQRWLGLIDRIAPAIPKYIAFTFDDGPSYDTTSRVLDLVEQNGIKVTFFVIGANIDGTDTAGEAVSGRYGSSYNLMRADSLGCEIGSHSWTHPNFQTLLANENYDQIAYEISETNAKIKQYTGKDTTLFRFPLVHSGFPIRDFDECNINMTYICGNFVGINSDDTIAGRTQKMKDLAVDGNIILCHDSFENIQTAEALEEAVPWLLARGYEFVTVSELAQIKGVTLDKCQTLYSAIR